MKILPHNYINGSVEYVVDRIVAFGPKQQSESSERNIMFLLKHCHNAFSLYISFSTVTRSINRQDRLSSGIWNIIWYLRVPVLPRNYQEICYNSRTNILTAVWNIKRNTNPPLLLPLRLLVWWVPSVISLIELSTIQDGGLLPCSSAFAPSVIDQNIPWNNTIMKKLGGK